MNPTKTESNVYCWSCGQKMVDLIKEKKRPNNMKTEEKEMLLRMEGYAYECRNEVCSEYKRIKIRGSHFK